MPTAHQVTLRPSGRVFPIEEGQDILAAAFAAGIKLRHSCRVGHCRACIGRIAAGDFDPGPTAERQLTSEARDKGFALLCRAMARSDLEIEAREVAMLAGPQTVPAYVKSVEKLTDDIARLTLRLPPSASMTFMAGQHVDFLLPDGRRRSYSIANAADPGGSVNLEFHIRHQPGGAFSDTVFTAMKAKDRITLEGPLGTFFLQEEGARRVFLCTGTGYAPIRAMILQALAKGDEQPMTLYCGMRAPAELYMLDEVRELAARHGNLTVVPVVSRPAADGSWDGRTGYVQDAALADLGSLADVTVYACGSPVMIAAAEGAFGARGLPPARFYFGAFVNESADA